MKTFTAVILPMLLITLFSCSGMSEEFKYMNRLRESISRKYEIDKVEINIKNSNALSVSLIDPKFDDYTSARKEQISREIGKLAQELREGKQTIKSGVVNFRDEENYGIVKSSTTDTFQMF